MTSAPVPAARAALLATGVVLGAALVAGVGVGLSVLAAELVPGEGMEGLGRLVMGLLFTILLTVATLVALAVVGARRYLPVGRRVPGVVGLLVPVLLVVVLAWATTTGWLLLLTLPAAVGGTVALTRGGQGPVAR